MTRSKIKAGEGYVEIGIRNRIAKGAAGVQRDLDQLSGKVGRLGALSGGLGLALGTPFAFAAKKLAGFDDAMRSVGAISRAVPKDLEMLTLTAKELGRTTSFTAEEVASLMIELARAGFDPSQIDAMTSSVLALARATGTDAALAASTVAASIRQFSLAAEDGTRVADAFTAAANGSFNTVESLAQAMTYAGPVANDFNMSIEETLAILGTLGNVGIQGSMAGTALRRLLTLTGAEAQKLQGIFGVSFVDAAGNARPLIDTLADVAEATNELGNAERMEKFNKAFGLLGITGASAIAKTTASTRELLQTIKDSPGIASKTAADMDAGLGGSFRKIASAAEGAVIAIAESYGPSLQQITDSLTASIGGITGWIESNKELVAAVAMTSAGLVGLGGGLLAVAVASKVASMAVGGTIAVTSAANAAYRAYAAITTIVKAATLATAAAFALATGASSGLAIGTALLNAAYGVSPAVAGAVATAWGIVGTVLAALSAPTTLATAMAGVLSAAWASAGAVVSAAWAVITGPLLPFIALGAAVVGIVGVIAAGLAYLAVTSIDFGSAFGKAKSMVAGILGVMREVVGTIKAALSAGDYAMAARALWAGIQLAFWEGVSGAMDAFWWLWDEAKSTAVRFGSRLLDVIGKIMSAVGRAIMNPFQAAKEIGTAIGELIGGATNFDVQGRADAARQELSAMRASLAIQKDRNEAEKEAAKIREQNKTQQEVNAEKKAKIDQLEQDGHLTSKEADTARSNLSENESDPFADKVKSIELEIMALEKGEAAADRKRLADEGLTDAQIRQIEVLKQKKKLLEQEKEAQETAGQRRVEAIFKKADRLSEDGVKPDEVFRRVMKQIRTDQDKGIISAETANDARADARSNLDDRMEQLRQEGKALAEALRTPAEILNAKLAKISNLQDSGNLSEKDALRAEDKARAEFNEAIDREKDVSDSIDQAKQETVGPTATFSAAAATIIGGGPRMENQQLKATQEVAANTAQLVKRSKKDNATRFSK